MASLGVRRCAIEDDYAGPASVCQRRGGPARNRLRPPDAAHGDGDQHPAAGDAGVLVVRFSGAGPAPVATNTPVASSTPTASAMPTPTPVPTPSVCAAAYVYSTDLGAARSYQALLQASGLALTLVPQTAVLSTAFSS